MGGYKYFVPTALRNPQNEIVMLFIFYSLGFSLSFYKLYNTS